MSDEVPATELVRLTERASEKIKGFLAQDGMAGRPLRFRVLRTHCMGGRGHTYDLSPADGPDAKDTVVEASGVTFVIDEDSARLLTGTQLDYVEGLETSGFTISNPNAVGKCPCGHHDLFA